ncbi:MAG: energy transducer TonB [Pyrinomonadaceae bacterium]
MRLTKGLGPLLLLTFAALSPAPRAAAQEGARTTASPYGAPPSAWTRYTYPGEEFSVELPSMPLLTHTVRSFGRFPNHKVEKMRVFSLYSGGVVFFVVAYDRPHQSESLDAFATYLRGAWGLFGKESAALGGFEGKSYGVGGATVRNLTAELHGEGYAFRGKRHAYFALALSKEAGRPEVGRFLDSLSLSLGSAPAGERVAEPAPVPRVEPPQGDAAAEMLRLRREAEARGANADGPFPARETTQRAAIVYKPEPGYSEEGRRNNTRGTVRLRVVLGAAGEVKDISVIKGLPDRLTEQSVAAARQMLFFPAVKDGRPVAQYVVLEYSFNIY